MKLLRYFIVLISLCYGIESSSQTATLYTAKRYAGTFKTLQAAVDAAYPYDSIVLSADTFKAYWIQCNGGYPIIYYKGTIKDGDTTVIDAQGHGTVFFRLSGTIKDVIFQNLDTFNYPDACGRGRPNYADITCGASVNLEGVIGVRNSVLNRFTFFNGAKSIKDAYLIIQNNTLLGFNYYSYPSNYYNNFLNLGGIFSSSYENTKILFANNKLYGDFACIGMSNDYFLKDVSIVNNTGGTGIRVYNEENKKDSLSMVNLYYLLIKNNRFGYDYKGAAVKIMDLAKTTKTLVRVNESYIYNPAPIGQKRIELRMDTSNRLSFESSASWWGSSDTSNLFSFAAPSSFKLNDWAIAHWYASPFGKYPLKVTNVRALIRNSKGYAFPDYSFRPMEGLFFALGGGSFSPTTSFISSSNVVASDFTLPDTGDYAVMAVIDADTFRPDNSKLKIVETSSSRISIAPNPTQDQLNIEGLKQPVVLQLLDMNSRILWQNNVYQNTFSLSLKAYSAGVYLLRIVEKEGSSTLFKILKE